MLKNLLSFLHLPPAPDGRVEEIDVREVVVLGRPACVRNVDAPGPESAPSDDLDTLHCLAVLNILRNPLKIAYTFDPQGSPQLSVSHRLPYIITTGLYEGRVFDSIYAYVRAVYEECGQGSEWVEDGMNVLALQLRLERVLFEPFYQWLFQHQRDLAVAIYGSNDDPFHWLKYYHIRWRDFGQHFSAPFSLPQSDMKALWQGLEQCLAKRGQMIEAENSLLRLMLECKIVCFVHLALKLDYVPQDAIPPAVRQYSAALLERAFPDLPACPG